MANTKITADAEDERIVIIHRVTDAVLRTELSIDEARRFSLELIKETDAAAVTHQQRKRQASMALRMSLNQKVARRDLLTAEIEELRREIGDTGETL